MPLIAPPQMVLGGSKDWYSWFRIQFLTKTKWVHMSIYLRGRGRGLQTFGIVISSKVLLETLAP